MHKTYKVIFIIFSFILFLFGVHNALALTLTPIRLEISGNPGQTLSEEMTLINERDTTETYYVSYANFEAQGETGTPTFVDAKDDLGTWMQAPDSISLAPGTSKIIPIKITIPKDADAGGHFAAIFWGTQPKSSTPGQVAIGAKTGMLVLLRVNGNVSENGGLLEFSTLNKQKFYTALPVSFFYRFQNNGGDRIKPTGDVKIKDILGITEKKIPGNPVDGNILPSSVRKIETVWQGKDVSGSVAEKDRGGFFDQVKYEWRNFAFGYYNAHIALTYGTKNEVATSAFSFWVFPWHLTIVVIILLALLYFVIKKTLKHYNHWVIAQAEKMLKMEEQKEAHEHHKNSARKV